MSFKKIFKKMPTKQNKLYIISFAKKEPFSHDLIDPIIDMFFVNV